MATVKWYCDNCVTTYKLTKKSPPEWVKCQSPKCSKRQKPQYCFKVEK